MANSARSFKILMEDFVSMLRCENCQGPMTPYHLDQRFCWRACSDAWFQEERRQAVEWFRACGMKPELRNGEQQREREARA
jgi:hypothetical protein